VTTEIVDLYGNEKVVLLSLGACPAEQSSRFVRWNQRRREWLVRNGTTRNVVDREKIGRPRERAATRIMLADFPHYKRR
jgi:hypothetical protein